MADIDVQRKAATPLGAGRGGLQTWIWPLVAVLAVAGLMWWLAMQAERTQGVALIEEQPGTPAGVEVVDPAAEVVELAGVTTAPDPYVGRVVRVEDVDVAATLGPSAFWADVPGMNPFLVMLSPDMTQRPQLAGGQSLNLQGTIAVVTDSLLNEWVLSGAIAPGRRDEAAFATHYLLADLAVVQR